MLIHTNTYPRKGILGITLFHQREHQNSHRLAWTVSCLPACVDALDLTGINNFHSQANSIQKGFRNTKMSSEIMEKLSSNVVVKENSNGLPLSSAYETAMEALSSLITRQKRGDRSAIGGKYGKLDRMLMYIKILGLEEHMAGLKIIHVAGTKGKGSTCTFCEAILRESGFRTGLFISPHLIDVRERFRLDGLDISEDKFLLYFWDCWNQLKENTTEDLPMPPLFQFLTVLAFKIFVSEKVEVAIIEVGLGGKKDSTNVIKEPVVCGITSLGMDHIEALGDTLGKIASHKAGIFKVPLEVAAPIDPPKLRGLQLSLSGDHQFINAGLAVSLCKTWLQRTGNWEKLLQNDSGKNNLPEAFLRGLSTARLSGRAQIVHDSFLKSYSCSEARENSSGDLIFYLDGAHSPESLEVCAKWFSNAVKVTKNLPQSSSPFKVRNVEELRGNGYGHHESEEESDKISKRILLFNCMEVRDPQILIPQLVNTCASSGNYFSKAIFVPSMSTYNKVTSGASIIPSDIPSRDLSWQLNLQRIWERIIHGNGNLLSSIAS